MRGLHQRIAVPGRNIDEIAEHIVELDLESADPGLVCVARLKGGNDLAGVRAQRPGFIQRCVPAFGNKAAIPGERWQVFRQGL